MDRGEACWLAAFVMIAAGVPMTALIIGGSTWAEFAACCYAGVSGGGLIIFAFGVLLVGVQFLQVCWQDWQKAKREEAEKDLELMEKRLELEARYGLLETQGSSARTGAASLDEARSLHGEGPVERRIVRVRTERVREDE